MTLTATARTPNASRYLQQLCKHWSHKFNVAFTPDDGRIELPLGRVELGADSHALTVRLAPLTETDAAALKEVVVRHIDRFAHKEGGLIYEWNPG